MALTTKIEFFSIFEWLKQSNSSISKRATNSQNWQFYLTIRHSTGWDHFHHQLQALSDFAQKWRFHSIHDKWHINQSSRNHEND